MQLLKTTLPRGDMVIMERGWNARVGHDTVTIILPRSFNYLRLKDSRIVSAFQTEHFAEMNIINDISGTADEYWVQSC